MSRRGAFTARPSTAPTSDDWVRTPRAEELPADPLPKAELYTARVTVDVTPALRGRIRQFANQRGVTAAQVLRQVLEAAFPVDPSEGAS